MPQKRKLPDGSGTGPGRKGCHADSRVGGPPPQTAYG
jgi:hypothetical protein